MVKYLHTCNENCICKPVPPCRSYLYTDLHKEHSESETVPYCNDCIKVYCNELCNELWLMHPSVRLAYAVRLFTTCLRSTAERPHDHTKTCACLDTPGRSLPVVNLEWQLPVLLMHQGLGSPMQEDDRILIV